ncbi:hypothetical protein BHE74_00031353 [Ensete ventricosum]|nr:hypothetical protein BHE74_00031353 [Ensete ventricosum]
MPPKEETHNGSVLDAEWRERVGGGDVDGGQRRPHDAEEEAEVRATAGGGRGTRELPLHPPPPPFLTVPHVVPLQPLRQRRKAPGRRDQQLIRKPPRGGWRLHRRGSDRARVSSPSVPKTLALKIEERAIEADANARREKYAPTRLWKKKKKRKRTNAASVAVGTGCSRGMKETEITTRGLSNGVVAEGRSPRRARELWVSWHRKGGR